MGTSLDSNVRRQLVVNPALQLAGGNEMKYDDRRRTYQSDRRPQMGAPIGAERVAESAHYVGASCWRPLADLTPAGGAVNRTGLTQIRQTTSRRALRKSVAGTQRLHRHCYNWSMPTHTTRVTRHIDAPRAEVYRALIDADAISQWKVPDAMTIQVHEHDGREGGRFRISLTYHEPGGVGKTAARRDTYHGHYVTLIPDEKVVEIDEFETSDEALSSPMTISITLAEQDGGTEVVVVHEGVPASVPAEDNDLGWLMALARLADLVERR